MGRTDDRLSASRRPIVAESLRTTAIDRLAGLARAFHWTEDIEGVRTRLDVAPPAETGDVPTLPDRYEDLGLLGQGGQGQVRLVCDHRLGRLAALKLLARPDHDAARARFSVESNFTAILEHPSIVPIYDRGQTRDRRPWYTMRYVHGVTLAQAIHEGRPLRRLVNAMVRVCEAVAFAHHSGVVHLDLKPDNILLGDFGQVFVTDWGLAQRHGDLTPSPGIGTPAYMPFEQAVGGQAADPSADVFALGSTLLHILRGSPPAPMSLPRGPDALCQLVRAARADAPEDRPPDAQAFLAGLHRWLDGEARREASEALRSRADALLPRLRQLETRARAAREAAEHHLAPLPSHAPTAVKRPGWRLAAEGSALARHARQLELKRIGLLQRALEADPDAPEPRQQLVALHRARLLAAETARDEAAIDAEVEALLALDPRGQAPWLQADGRLCLRTTEPAEAWLASLVEHDRHRVPVPMGPLGPTPIDVELPQGNYHVVLRAHGRQPVIYPVVIRRAATWDATPPGATEPVAIPLPPTLGDAYCYVPPGWFIAGGDANALDGLLRQRVWVDGFVMMRTPVSNAAYLTFLNALVAAGREAEAQAYTPEDAGTAPYLRTADGQFVLNDACAQAWCADAPVTRVRAAAAQAYAAWRAEADGLPWRLPHGLEWEKAARGVDARWFSMGDTLDPTWANVLGGSPSLPGPTLSDAHPIDCSVYGVRGLSGNVRDMCGNRFRQPNAELDGRRLDPCAPEEGEDTTIEVRGGSFNSPPAYCRAAVRFGLPADTAGSSAGFRLVRSWPG